MLATFLGLCGWGQEASSARRGMHTLEGSWPAEARRHPMAAKDAPQSGFGCQFACCVWFPRLENMFSDRKTSKPVCKTFLAAKNAPQSGFGRQTVCCVSFLRLENVSSNRKPRKNTLWDVFGSKKRPAEWFRLLDC